MSFHLPEYALPKCGIIRPMDDSLPDCTDPDPRGLVKLWEPPNPRARYVLAIDPSGGIVNWDRYHRSVQDNEVDNSAVEVIRCGNDVDLPDVQVAEYAAPITAEDVAEVAVLLGRMYAGNSETGEALCIIETWPGPGLLTHQAMVQKHGYLNMWRWEYLDSMLPKASNSFGWQSNTKTLQYLWSRFSRHLGKRLIKIRSAYLQAELNNLQNVPGKTFPQPIGERAHDDRVRAMATAIWAAHRWSFGEGILEPQRINDPKKYVNLQASDCSLEQMEELWEDMYNSLIND